MKTQKQSKLRPKEHLRILILKKIVLQISSRLEDEVCGGLTWQPPSKVLIFSNPKWRNQARKNPMQQNRK